jgi:hypothetical protein
MFSRADNSIPTFASHDDTPAKAGFFGVFDMTTSTGTSKENGKAASAPIPAPAIGESVTFADQKFKSRMIVLADGRTFAVEKSRIVATDPVLIAHLDKRQDFKRVAGA